MRRIDTLSELETLYGPPVAAALSKVADHLTPPYRRWIEAARFCVMSTVGPNGAHGTPRGDVDPVVRVTGPNTILLPDWAVHRWTSRGAPGAGRWVMEFVVRPGRRVPRQRFNPQPASDSRVLIIERRE